MEKKYKTSSLATILAASCCWKLSNEVRERCSSSVIHGCSLVLGKGYGCWYYPLLEQIIRIHTLVQGSHIFIWVGLDNYSSCKLTFFFLCLSEEKRNWREETESELKAQLYLELQILQIITDINSFLLLWVILLILREQLRTAKLSRIWRDGNLSGSACSLHCAAVSPTGR